jgi:hypothetical protein
MTTIPELLDGHITLEEECLDRLYLNGYIGELATGPGPWSSLCGISWGNRFRRPLYWGRFRKSFAKQ